ncbi:glycosyl hydrolase family 18 protein [Nocardioides sp. zg-DK7169]|uniref:glycosyl hydrolase family 18 protein n=1 Tax=Nocardioides sp. zg-DK7169 TaxID=2736600 RepID=UPI00155339F4|nr:hydrolase [Nocardioides sp. zg-DK7169]
MTARLAALSLTLALAVTTVPAHPAHARDDWEPAVTGYALESTPPRVVDRNAEGLTTVTVVASLLHPSGGRVGTPGARPRALLAAAHRAGLRAELLLSGWNDRLGDFDPRAAHRLLSSPPRIRRVAGQLARVVRVQGWDGVNLDLERLRRADAPGLVRLAAALQRRMPSERTVSVDVSARTSLRAYRRAGYRLGELAGVVDVVQLMAYDQHGPGWSGPGPVGALPWQRAALGTALRVVPPERLDLGVAGYGYTWPRTGTGRSLTVAAARRLVRRDGAVARWRPRAGEWSARLSDGTRLWWSDRRSYAARVRLAEEHDLHGLAVWRLGSADTLTRPGS